MTPDRRPGAVPVATPTPTLKESPMPATTARRPGLLPAVLSSAALELHRASRNRRYLMTAIIFPVVFYALFTGVLQGGGADPTAGGGLVWKTYYMVSMAAYGAIGAALGGAIVI